MFHCSSTWSNTNDNTESIVITYGRSNPSKLYDTIVELQLDNLKDDCDLTENNFLIRPFTNNLERVISLARFRHATCTDSSRTNLFIYGGKYFDEKLNKSVNLNDLHVFDKTGSILKSMVLSDDLCKSRHSHSMCYWGNFIIISGGIDISENSLNDIIMIDINTYEVIRFSVNNGTILPR